MPKTVTQQTVQTNADKNMNYLTASPLSWYLQITEYLQELSDSEQRHALADILDMLEQKYPKEK